MHFKYWLQILFQNKLNWSSITNHESARDSNQKMQMRAIIHQTWNCSWAGNSSRQSVPVLPHYRFLHFIYPFLINHGCILTNFFFLFLFFHSTHRYLPTFVRWSTWCTLWSSCWWCWWVLGWHGKLFWTLTKTHPGCWPGTSSSCLTGWSTEKCSPTRLTVSLGQLCQRHWKTHFHLCREKNIYFESFLLKMIILKIMW